MCDNPNLAEILDLGAPPRIVGPIVDCEHYYEHYRHLKRFILLPCGKCLSCQMSRAHDWSIRVMHEVSLYDLPSSFVTLTYNDDHLPSGGNLCRADVQDFFKRLRILLVRDRDHDWSSRVVRYFGCGEYGHLGLRPHYHLILFGFTFPDAEVFGSTSKGSLILTSRILSDLWPFGFSSIGNVTEDSIQYVARYSLKKVQQDLSCKSVRPFTMASSRPAIGLKWVTQYSSDLVKLSPDGSVCRRGYIPRYYRKKLECVNPRLFDALLDDTDSYLSTAVFSPEAYFFKSKSNRIRESRFFSG